MIKRRDLWETPVRRYPVRETCERHLWEKDLWKSTCERDLWEKTCERWRVKHHVRKGVSAYWAAREDLWERTCDSTLWEETCENTCERNLWERTCEKWPVRGFCNSSATRLQTRLQKFHVTFGQYGNCSIPRKGGASVTWPRRRGEGTEAPRKSSLCKWLHAQFPTNGI